MLLDELLGVELELDAPEPLWFCGVLLPEPDGLLLDELLEPPPDAPLCASRSRFMLGSAETLPDAEPETEPPVEAFGWPEGAAAVELEDDPGADALPDGDGAVAVELEDEPGADAVPDGGGVTVVDELEAPGPPEERSTRSSPQPTSATATADAASSKRKFDFISRAPCSWR